MVVQNYTIAQPIAANASQLYEILSNIPGFSNLIKIGQIAGVVVIVYIVFLIFKTIIEIRKNFKLRVIRNKLEDLELKIDLLMGPKKLKQYKKEKAKLAKK